MIGMLQLELHLSMHIHGLGDYSDFLCPMSAKGRASLKTLNLQKMILEHSEIRTSY
jgi:hypothetical protein